MSPSTRRGVTEQAAIAAIDSGTRVLRLPTIRDRFEEIAAAAQREQLAEARGRADTRQPVLEHGAQPRLGQASGSQLEEELPGQPVRSRRLDGRPRPPGGGDDVSPMERGARRPLGAVEHGGIQRAERRQRARPRPLGRRNRLADLPPVSRPSHHVGHSGQLTH